MTAFNSSSTETGMCFLEKDREGKHSGSGQGGIDAANWGSGGPSSGGRGGHNVRGGSRCFRSRRVSRWDRSDDRSGGGIERIGGVDAQDADSNGALEACAADFGAIGTVRATLLSALFVIGTPQSGCGSGKGFDAPGACSQLANETFTAFCGPGRIGRTALLRALSQHATRKSGAGSGKGLDAPGACSQLANETFTAFRGPGRIGRAARLRAFSQHATCRRRKSGAGSGEGLDAQGADPGGTDESFAADFGPGRIGGATLLRALSEHTASGRRRSGAGRGEGLDAQGADSSGADETGAAFCGPVRARRAALLGPLTEEATVLGQGDGG